MEQNQIFKIFCVLAFLAFAAVSCWATAESLHLLLPSWPLVMCWIVTIGFFFIASFGTKMIADSLNQNVYVEKRGVMMAGGILITFVFWLLCSMPTNTSRSPPRWWPIASPSKRNGIGRTIRRRTPTNWSC